MKNMSPVARVYILSIIIIGLGLIGWMGRELVWVNPGLYVLATLGAVARILKVEGPNERTNYSLAWFVYGFAFIAYGSSAAMIVMVISILAEWAWHKYPWYIQSFNIGNHVIAVYLAGLVFEVISQETKVLDLNAVIGMAAAFLAFTLANHFLVGMVVKLTRGQSFSESGVFGNLTLFIDFTLLAMGGVTALIWFTNPFASLLNILPLYLLYNALRVPALKRQLQEMKKSMQT